MRIVSCLVALVAATITSSAFAESYTFKVSNTTKERITKLQVSEDGSKWGSFDIGKGIDAGESATLVWAESTNDQGCKQKIKAGFEDGSESKVADFDFCEEDLSLEF